MAYNENLVLRVRAALADAEKVVEKKMFGGLAFIINGKMSITVGKDRTMCRVDPIVYDNLLLKPGAKKVEMGGKNYKGYIHVDESAIRTKKQLQFWIDLALEFNGLITGL